MKKVYIGDPCYVIVDNQWKEFCSIIENLDLNESDMIIDFCGSKMFVMQTKYGDGMYSLVDDINNCISKLSVDSGLLSVIDVDMIKNVDGLKFGMLINIEDIDSKHVYTTNNSSNMVVGMYSVETDYYRHYDDDDEDEDEYYRYDDDEDEDEYYND